MRVLIGGEFSGIIRDAFIKNGHDATSCDFKDNLSPGPHYKGNWKDIWGNGYDIGIFHPTCRYVANSSSKHLYLDMKKSNGLNTDRWLKMGKAAWEFWDLLETCPIPRFAVENPVMLGYSQIMSRKPNQTVQPWWFGDNEYGPDNCKKATCWWLNGLDKLVKTGTLDGSTARDEVHKMAPTTDPEERRMQRSKFYPGMAQAIVEQWGAE